MREIKFRGKTIIDNEWLISQSHLGEMCSGTIRRDFLPKTVGQYTGLKDQNGVEMYEGDIVAGLFHFGLPIKGVIQFQDGAFGLTTYFDVPRFSAFTSYCRIDFEVLGNIYDNPEMIRNSENPAAETLFQD